MKQLIVYDLDGTLVDTKQDIAQSVNYMLGVMGSSALTIEEIQRLVGRGVPYLVKHALDTDDEERLNKGVSVYREHYHEHMLDTSALFPGAIEFLEHFRERKQAVITNKPDPYSSIILQELGVIYMFMDVITGNSEVFPRKPDPTSLLNLMRRFGVSPNETVYIGDSPLDVETGKNASVYTVGITHGFSPPDELRDANPDMLVSGFRELLIRVKKRCW